MYNNQLNEALFKDHFSWLHLTNGNAVWLYLTAETKTCREYLLMENRIIAQSTKWSVITEFITKIASPAVNIILARILVPQVFGLVATFMVVTSFAEVFTDAGFQKYLVQHEFLNKEERDQYTNVAFWSNLCLSCIIWVLICFNSSKVASIVGSPGYGLEITILSLQIPLYAFSSIQTALFRRDFRFKQLLPIRLVDSAIPLFVTVPLAFLLRNCWAIIIGNLTRQCVNSILLTLRSKWKPRFYYSFEQLKVMFSDCFWMLLDSIMIWLTSYLGTLIVSHFLDTYYIGIYKTGISTITPYMNLIYTMTAPVLFAALSRLQTDRIKADETFRTYQKYASFIALPIGTSIFTYREAVTSILLGSQWTEATLMIGCVGLTLPFCIIVAQYNSDYFRAMGKPRVAFTVQGIYLLFMTFSLLQAVKYSFKALCVVTGALYIIYCVISAAALSMVFNFDIKRAVLNILPSLTGSFVLMCTGLYLKSLFKGTILWDIFCGIITLIIYFLCLIIIPSSRKDLMLIKELKKRTTV